MSLSSRAYLAGPISGLTYAQSEGWRDDFIKQVNPSIKCFSPLRVKGFLKDCGIIEQSYTLSPLATDRGIMSRDFNDCSNADLVVCNLLDTTRVSIGTVMEMAWCFQAKIPLITIMQPGNCHDHPMTREATNFCVSTVEEAIELTHAILLPY